MATTYLVVIVVAFAASGLTFFSGFGLGTLLLPAFRHLLPGGARGGADGGRPLLERPLQARPRARHHRVTGRGALLLSLSGIEPLATYRVLGRTAQVTAVKLVVGGLLLVFGVIELGPQARGLSFSPHYLPVGGALSGLFGGLSGMQGALRSAFLVRAGLSKESFIATGVVAVALFDVSRLGVYTRAMVRRHGQIDYVLLGAAVLAAFAGAAVGNQWLQRITMEGVRHVVAGMLQAAASAPRAPPPPGTATPAPHGHARSRR